MSSSEMPDIHLESQASRRGRVDQVEIVEQRVKQEAQGHLRASLDNGIPSIESSMSKQGSSQRPLINNRMQRYEEGYDEGDRLQLRQARGGAGRGGRRNLPRGDNESGRPMMAGAREPVPQQQIMAHQQVDANGAQQQFDFEFYVPDNFEQMGDDFNQYGRLDELINQGGPDGQRSMTFSRMVVKDDREIMQEQQQPLAEVEEDQEEGSDLESPRPQYRRRRASHYNSDVYKLDDEKISCIKLRSHINVNHPRKSTGEKYGVCDEVGSLPCMNCCFKKLPRMIQEDNKRYEKDAIYISELSEGLGLGSSLFLFYTKSLAWLFFFLTILNIPTMAFFATGNESEIENVQGLFAKLSLGNIGQDEGSCSTYSYQTYKSRAKLINVKKNMTLSCPYGKLNYIYGYGLLENATSKCEAGQTSLDFIDEECRDAGLYRRGAAETFTSFFKENCRGATNCSVPVDQVFDPKLLTTDCADGRAKRIANQEVTWVIQAACRADSIVFEAIDYEYPKERFGILVVAIDLLAVVSILIFLKVIKLRQKEFIEQYRQQTITMPDFALRVKHLPNDVEFDDREEILTAQLWEHFQTVLVRAERKESMKRQQRADPYQERRPAEEEKRDFEIADITFGKEKIDATEALMKLWDDYKEVQKAEANKSRKFKTSEKKAKYEALYQEAKEHYQQSKIQYQKEHLKVMELYRKSELKQIQRNPNRHSYKYAYVLLKSMKDADAILQAYNVNPGYRFMILHLCPACCCRRRYKELSELKFKGRWLDVVRADEPDEIKWENNGYSGKNRTCRRIIIWITAIVIILLGVTAMIYITQATQDEKESYEIDKPCYDVITPQNEFEQAELAYYDKIENNDQLGLMNCFCQYQKDKSYTDSFQYTFVDVNPADDTKYCLDIFAVEAKQLAVVYGSSLMIVFINALICYIFERISYFEKHHTQNGETEYQFKKIVIMQFTNIALIILLVNFNATKYKDFFVQNLPVTENGLLFGFLPILNGGYTDFSAQWYSNVGAILCVTLTFNIFSPHGSLIGRPIIQLIQRCWDRGCRCRFAKAYDKDSEFNDDVHTKQDLQSELQNLYTGQQIRVHYVYAQIYTTVWACLMYSSGIPILYPIGCCFFIGMYWMCKILLVHYFQKSTKFNEKLQLFSLSYLKYSVFFHMIIGSVMYSNSKIFSQQVKEDVSEEVNYVLKRISEFEFFEGRFKATHSQLYLAVLLLLVLLYCLKRFVFKKLNFALKFVVLCGCCRKQKAKQETAKDIFVISDNVYKEMELSQLAELYKRATRELNDFKELMAEPDTNALKQRLSKQFLDHHAQKLVARLKAIEWVIDNHLKLLLYNKGAPRNNIYERYNKYSYFKKMMMLMANKKVLWQRSQRLLNGRLKILRMKSVTQSYYINDSAQYQVAKRMERIIESEDFQHHQTVVKANQAAIQQDKGNPQDNRGPRRQGARQADRRRKD